MDDKGDIPKKQTQTQTQKQISSSPKEPLDESSSETRHHHHHQDQSSPVLAPLPFPLYVQSGATTSSPPIFDQKFDTVNPKRSRYTTTGQWTILPSTPSSQPKQQTQLTMAAGVASASSSDTTTSSPSQSPIPCASAASGGQQDTDHLQGQKNDQKIVHHQYRKGKYVSPVWKPNEMLWLAKAWRAQYQVMGNSDWSSPSGSQSRGKTRADKDREVSEFLQRNGVNRDAKTAGTKWDNMLGEFRKVYEWEIRGGGGDDLVGKSYFRLSPYERKIHRLPASFDEQVFDELSQFMASRIRSSSLTRVASGEDNRTGSPLATPPPPSNRPLALPAPPPSFREDQDLSLTARARKLGVPSGGSGGDPPYYQYGMFSRVGGGSLGSEYSCHDMNIGTGGTSSSLYTRDNIRRIGKLKMTWEESVSLWSEDQLGDNNNNQRLGRVRIQGSSFLNADELTFFDDSMVACSLEVFEDGPLKGFSVDRFLPGQNVKVFGRRKSVSASTSSGFTEKFQLPLTDPSVRSTPLWEYHDPTEYYLGCLLVPPSSLPSLFELSWNLQDPPPEDFRFPLRRDVYRDLPQGREVFFTTSSDMLDCRAITYDILSPLLRPNPSITAATSTSRESYIGLWDDCINRLVSKFCSVEMVLIRKPGSGFGSSVAEDQALQDQWPNVTGFIKNLCLWRGEEADQLRDGQIDPSNSIVEKLLWTYMEIPYLLGYYAVGYLITFCALSRAQDRVIRTDLYSLDLSTPTERLKALVPCYRIAGLLPLLADRCFGFYKIIQPIYSDFERTDLGNGNVIEMTPNTVTRFFSSRRKWGEVKEIYDFLDHRIPHAEYIVRAWEKDLGLVFKPRGCKLRPTNCNQLIEALKYVTKSLVALHDLSFMHRDISWDKVMRRNDREDEWFLSGFDEAAGAPQIYPHPQGGGGDAVARGRHAPEMERGLHGVKVDVWGVGYLVKTSGVGGGGGGGGVPKLLRELQNRCMDQNPEQRPTAADCYHHLLQLQSSLSTAAGGGVMM